MELVAMDMKLRGLYIARQLSFKGVSFKIEEIPVNKEFAAMYNLAVQLVCIVFRFIVLLFFYLAIVNRPGLFKRVTWKIVLLETNN